MVPLPPYARRVEYLESTGTQWIDTGLGVTVDTRIVARWTQMGVSVNQRLFGMNDGAPANLSLYINGSGDWALALGTAAFQLLPSAAVGDCTVDANLATGAYTFTNGSRSVSGTAASTPFTSTNTIPIFARNTLGTIAYADYPSTIRLADFTIYHGSTTVRSFVPCRILDVGYLWDEVEGKFYGNQGTGYFVLGPDAREGVVPTRMNPLGVGRRQEEIRKVEYLEATGTQYIDTGINYYADFEVSIRLRESVPNRALGINSNNCLQRINQQSPYWRFTGGGRNTDTTVLITERHTMAWLGTKVMADGATVATAAKGYASGGMQLFGASNTGYPNMIYWCRIYDSSDVLVRDFVPVAIGSTGYLLDRVSGRLFGNQGTGDFVVGPDIVPRLRVWGNGVQSSLFDISTPYPLAAGNPVTGTVNGDARSGILDSNLYTVNDAGGNYVGEFIDLTPGGTDSPALRWFDLVAGSPFVGYCEIV